MSVLRIHKYGDPVLKKKAESILSVSLATKKLIKDMFSTMYKAGGIGLAAPQVGISKRIVVIDISKVNGEEKPIILINPEIIEKEGEQTGEEGCLSFDPEIKIDIKRAAKIYVKAINIEGKKQEISAKSLLARVLQHEIDHLEGVLLIDKMSFSDKLKFRKQLNAKQLKIKR